MFSPLYQEIDKEVRIAIQQSHDRGVTRERVINLMQKARNEQISLTDAAILLRTAEEPALFSVLNEGTQQRFGPSGMRVNLLAPLYLSNYCVDECGYCNFATPRDINRTRLSEREIQTEVEHLIGKGYRIIEFTLGTDPEFSIGVLSKSIETTKKRLLELGGGAVLLCSTYLSKPEYDTLRLAGLDGMVQWAETYDQESYGRWHRGGPKSRFEERLDNYDRSLQAGIPVATGFLFGLSDFRYDTLFHLRHIQYLIDTYGTIPFTTGTPRIKPVPDKEKLPTKTNVSDIQYQTSLLVSKTTIPALRRWLQTREDFGFNLELLLDNDLLTVECGQVKPGGYIKHSEDATGGQFKVNELSLTEVIEILKTRGFNPQFCWWSSKD